MVGMIYLIFILIIFVFILLLFVVKLQNKVGDLEDRLDKTPEVAVDEKYLKWKKDHEDGEAKIKKWREYLGSEQMSKDIDEYVKENPDVFKPSPITNPFNHPINPSDDELMKKWNEKFNSEEFDELEELDVEEITEPETTTPEIPLPSPIITPNLEGQTSIVKLSEKYNNSKQY
jgi:hypothetical protein